MQEGVGRRVGMKGRCEKESGNERNVWEGDCG